MTKRKPTDTIEVVVTQSDIDKGIPNNERHCPIARALRRTYLGRWAVDGDFITLERPDFSEVFYSLPEEASLFVDSFDTKTDVAPFTFTAQTRTPYAVDE